MLVPKNDNTLVLVKSPFLFLLSGGPLNIIVVFKSEVYNNRPLNETRPSSCK